MGLVILITGVVLFILILMNRSNDDDDDEDENYDKHYYDRNDRYYDSELVRKGKSLYGKHDRYGRRIR